MLRVSYKDFRKLKGIQFSRFGKLNSGFSKVKGISIDTRTLREGEVFWALEGEKLDGHDFIKDAALKKACFAVAKVDFEKNTLAESFPLVLVPDTLKALQELATIQRRKYNIPVIAVTGSNGKTTVKEMIAQVLGRKRLVLKTDGNLNNHIGCPLTLLRLNPEHEAAVIECGTNHPGEIETLAQITQANQAVITDISKAHLEYFGTLEAIAREKLTLFDMLPSQGVAYKNLDNEFISNYKRKSIEFVTFSMAQKADSEGRVLALDSKGCAKFSLNNSVPIQLKVSGLHNVKNALAAAAVGLNFGLSLSEIKDALESLEAYNKRMQLIEKQGITIINDAYNANPSSMLAAFDTIRAMKRKGHLFLILGDMFELGEASVQLHLHVLQKAIELDPEKILILGKSMALAQNLLDNSVMAKTELFSDYAQLAEQLKSMLREGDLVLIKGSRGMTMERVLEPLDELKGCVNF